MLPLFALIALVVTGQVAFATTCTLTIPNNPLTAQGLATPFVLQTGCSMAVPGQEVFVEGAIYDPNTNTVSVYNPLVIDQGKTAAAAPVVPALPVGAVVGLWFGTNAGALKLAGDLKNGNCVNGLTVNGAVDIFGQFAYCNGPTFFANAANVQLPALGTASDGLPCLTTRDFALIDMDQSDNVITQYILTTNKTTAQNTVANQKKLKIAATLANGSDNLLLTVLDGIMGCKPVTGRDLAETSVVSFIPCLALNELAAARLQAQPQAIVPDNDPMVRVNNVPEKAKLDLYRVGVNQPVGVSASTADYCKNYAAIAPPRFLANKNLLLKSPSVDTGTGDTMFTFLAARFENSFGADGLNCTGLGMTPPITTAKDVNGVAVDATINLAVTGSTTSSTGGPPQFDTKLIAGAIGGGIGGILLLGGAAVFMRRQSRRSMDRGAQITSPAGGFGGGGGLGGGVPPERGGFAASFKNFRQSFMPSQWGQNIRQSMARFGGGSVAFGANKPMSPMASSPNSLYAPPSQYGNAPNPYGSAPNPMYGNQPPPGYYNQPPYGGGYAPRGF